MVDSVQRISLLLLVTFSWSNVVQGLAGCVSLIASAGTVGIIFSHDDPDQYTVSNYANNYDKCWTIQTLDSDHIKVTAAGFQLQPISGSTCLDYLAIYNADSNSSSDLVGKYCGTTFNTYSSTSREIVLHFFTDATTTSVGFKIDYQGETGSGTTDVGQVVGFTLLTLAVVVIGVIMMIMCVTAHYNKQRHVHVEHNHPEDVKHKHSSHGNHHHNEAGNKVSPDNKSQA